MRLQRAHRMTDCRAQHSKLGSHAGSCVRAIVTNVPSALVVSRSIGDWLSPEHVECAT